MPIKKKASDKAVNKYIVRGHPSGNCTMMKNGVDICMAGSWLDFIPKMMAELRKSGEEPMTMKFVGVRPTSVIKPNVKG